MADNFEKSIESCRVKIETLYSELQKYSFGKPEDREECIKHLIEAEQNILTAPSEQTIAKVRQSILQAEMLLKDKTSKRTSFYIVFMVFYVFIGLLLIVSVTDFFDFVKSDQSIYDVKVLEIPISVWLWSSAGSFTSMLFKAWNEPFYEHTEAVRWILARPVVGVAMGAVSFLLIKSGLLVFGGAKEVSTPELISVVAFIAAFSDKWSITLLDKLAQSSKVEATHNK